MLKTLLQQDGPATITITVPMKAVTDVVSPPTYPMPINGSKPIANDADKEGKGSMYDVIEVGGRLYCRLDSIQAQANRMEGMFKDRYRYLIPQTVINTSKGVLHIVDLGHRICDAFLMCTDFAPIAQKAIDAYRAGDALPLAKIAPTSLIYGFWDSRRSGTKGPRIVQSEITASDVHVNRKSAQFFATGNMPNDDVDALMEEIGFGDMSKDEASTCGLKDAPSTNKLGGIYVRGEINRKLVVSLETVRAIRGQCQAELQEYILGLALLASLTPTQALLRQGCTLVPSRKPTIVGNYNDYDNPVPESEINLSRSALEPVVTAAASAFGVGEAFTCSLCRKAAAAWRATAKKDNDAEGKGKKGKKK